MNYAPQSWLADWSAMTDALTKGEDNMPSGVYERKPQTRICYVCGNEYTAMGNKAKYCPECKKRHDSEYF